MEGIKNDEVQTKMSAQRRTFVNWTLKGLTADLIMLHTVFVCNRWSLTKQTKKEQKKTNLFLIDYKIVSMIILCGIVKMELQLKRCSYVPY